MLVEHARNLLGIDAASHAEYGLGGVEVVSLLSCSLTESQIEISITPGSALAAIHAGERRRVERTHCSYGLAPDFAFVASSAGMSGRRGRRHRRGACGRAHATIPSTSAPSTSRSAARHASTRIRSGSRSSTPSPADPAKTCSTPLSDERGHPMGWWIGGIIGLIIWIAIAFWPARSRSQGPQLHPVLPAEPGLLPGLAHPGVRRPRPRRAGDDGQLTLRSRPSQ